MKILFMGTPEIAVPSLLKLAEKHEICGVFSQSDKPVGRKAIITPSAVKLAAQKLDVPIFQPKSMKTSESIEIVKRLAPDLIALKAYGKILPKEILDIPKYGCLNAHASLLPRYRGAAPIQYSLLNGDSVTGITAMMMGEGMDTGDIVLQKSLRILESDDAISLFEKMAPLGAEVMDEAIDLIISGKAEIRAQDESQATYAPLIKKLDGYFNFCDDAREIVNKVRGYAIWPNASFEYEDKRIKVFSAKYREQDGAVGEILSKSPLIIAAKNGAVELVEIMPQNGKRMSGTAFLSGIRLQKGESLI